MDNIVSVKLDSRYASTLGVWQYDYGQVLRITGPELPPAVEVQFSLDEKSGETLSRVGTTVDGVTEVKIPDELLTHSATSNYRIYAYIYLTDETSGNTKYEIIIPVRVRSKPTSPTEDPETDPDLFRETVVAVNASAERAENAASSAMESAASAEETLIEIKRVTDGISEDIENANTAKSELSDMINSAGIGKKELESSIGKAGEAKTALDSSISSAGEKQLALDATVEQANAVDASLKEQIGSAEQIQANVEQIAKNKADISSLNEDIVDLQDKKITKFYASNQGEKHLVDSDNGKIQDMVIYGMSEQESTTGANLIDVDSMLNECLVKNDDGTYSILKTETNRFSKRFPVNLKAGTKVRFDADVIEYNGTYSTKLQIVMGDYTPSAGQTIVLGSDITEVKIYQDNKNDVGTYTKFKNAMLSIGEAQIPYEPYTGGKPSPSPEYPQEIVSVGGNGSIEVNVRGKNLVDVYGYSANDIPNPEAERVLFNIYGTTLSTTEKTDKLIVHQEIIDVATTNNYASGYFCIGINRKLEANKDYIITFRINVIRNPLSASNVKVSFNGIEFENGKIIGDKVTVKAKYTEYRERQYVEVRNSGMSLEISDFMVTEVGETDDYEPYTEQSVQLPYTFNAIPVASGGNVTINGQQYIADRVVEKDGVFGIERNIREIHTNTKTMNNSEEYPGWNKVEGVSDVTYYNEQPVGTSRVLTFISNFTQSTLCQNNIKPNNIVFLRRDIIGYSQSELIAKAIDVDMYIRLQDAIFEPLPGDIQAKLRTLVTNYPVTNISVTSDQLDGYTVFNYPISMANGWNYVKQQLGDTRDYIYDMDAKAQDIDLQSAEAYVNSEYAVALTELEV